MAALNIAAIVGRAQKELEIEKQAEVIADEDNCTPLYRDLDDLPSYEEFVNGAPPEPLFEQRTLDMIDYGTRHFHFVLY
jgi:hypothetical protein